MSNIDAVIWDFGGVFTSSPFHAIAEIATERSIDIAVVADLVFGDYGQDTDHPWHRLERGEITLAETSELVDARAVELGVDLTLADALTAISKSGGGGKIWDEMSDRVRLARTSGLRTGLLTNNLAEIRELWRPLLPLDELFDDVVDSSEVGCRKPDPAIYLMACERLGGVDPARTIFLDDAATNVAAAEAVGMTGILVVHGEDSVLAELDRLTGLSPSE